MIVPPWASTIPRQIARPSPAPGRPVPFTRKNFSKMRVSLPAGSPGPWSATSITVASSVADAEISIDAPAGVYLRAFSNKLMNTCSNSTGSTETMGRSAGSCTWTLRPLS